MQGWIKIHRKLMASEIFQNEKLLKVFMYCLLKATHSDHVSKVGRQKINLLPGQFVFGRKKASLELNMKESTVRDYMNILKDDEVITMKTTNKYSVITVVNWEIYQSKEEDSDNKHDNKKTAEGQQINTYKNGNNGENEKDYTSQIKNLLLGYPSDIQDLITVYWNEIKKTRKSGVIQKSVMLKTMQKWDKYEHIVIKYSLKTHLDKYGADRDEKYTIGIMRQTTPDEALDRLNRTSYKLKQEPSGQLPEFNFGE